MTLHIKKGNIQLGDLASALHKLGWKDADHTKAIASCLGFNLDQMPEKKHQTEIADPRLTEKPAKTGSQPKAEKAPGLPPQPDLPPPMPTARSFSNLEPLDELAASASEDNRWKTGSGALLAEEPLPRLARLSLFPDRISRHLFTAALGTRRQSREIDIQQLIDRVCTELVIQDIPLKLETTLESGCHLLRDFSQTMVPWWEDLIALTQQVKEVIGASRLQAYSFDTLPAQPMRWTPRGKRELWQADGRPVLIATDFGIQGVSSAKYLAQEWHGFIDQCEQAGSPLVILTPWPGQFCPKDLSAYPKLLHWSPHTTVAMIKKYLGELYS